ncbi:MAG: hypothetical protein OQK82_06395 [Candidatus Pacearchaeota archaeon]|nr:hypothetical protein [Candidatus Pacearchaeota archaeon]
MSERLPGLCIDNGVESFEYSSEYEEVADADKHAGKDTADDKKLKHSRFPVNEYVRIKRKNQGGDQTEGEEKKKNFSHRSHGEQARFQILPEWMRIYITMKTHLLPALCRLLSTSGGTDGFPAETNG